MLSLEENLVAAERFKHLFLKTGCYSNSHTLALSCTEEDLNLRVPLGETGLQLARFDLSTGLTHLYKLGGKVDESNAIAHHDALVFRTSALPTGLLSVNCINRDTGICR